MARGMTRREFAAGAGGAIVISGIGRRARAATADDKTLRFIAADRIVRVLDPIWTTAYVTRNHGYMVFDTLLRSTPSSSRTRRWSTITNSRRTSFLQLQLRDGLKFHDGQPVRGARLRRLPQALDGARLVRPDPGNCDRRDERRRRQELLDPSEGAVSAADRRARQGVEPGAVHHARTARQDRPLTSRSPRWSGRGHSNSSRRSFSRATRSSTSRTPTMCRASEPPSWASGGKVVKVDRVEWLIVPDHATAAARSTAGEVDWWENPPADLLAGPGRQPRRHACAVRPARGHGLSALQSPLSAVRQVKMRQAVLMVTESGRFHDRIRRRPEELEDLPVVLHLRHADGEQRRLGGADRQARFRCSQKAGRRGRVQGRKDHRARCGRSAADPRRGAGRDRFAEKARAQCRDTWPATGARW